MDDSSRSASPRMVLAVTGLLVLGVIVGFAFWRSQLTREVNRELAAMRAAGFPTSGAELNAYYPAVPSNVDGCAIRRP